MDVVDFLLMGRCVELVHEEMQRIIQHCGNEVQQEMLRLIALKSGRLQCTVHPSGTRFFITGYIFLYSKIHSIEVTVQSRFFPTINLFGRNQ
jgi:hypothetical protein